MSLFPIFKPLIHALPPECAHDAAIFALRHGLLPAAKKYSDPALATTLFGLNFPHPLGLAAGFDKNAAAMDGLLKQGFAFVEAGTVTPKPQPGNPRPRLFRVSEQEAIINRLGFNNHGLEVFCAQFSKRNKAFGIAGANIGKNKDSGDAVADYVLGLHAVYPLADYITINISSPNTQGLRDLQQKEALSHLLSTLAAERNTLKQKHARHVALLLKIAPDISLAEQEAIVRTVLEYGIDGLIVSNTTIARRPELPARFAHEMGGLSGKPLMQPSTKILASIYKISEGKIPLIGVGGIASADDAYAKIRAGASLLQLYTALIYQGFGLVTQIQKGLSERLKRDGFTQIKEAVGVDVC